MPTRIALAISLVMAASAARADFVLDYENGALTTEIQTGSPPTLPDLMGEVTLSAPLPANGTETITPISFSFSTLDGLQNSDFANFVNNEHGAAGASAEDSFTFTTVNGQITSWDVELYAVNGQANQARLILDQAGAFYTYISDNNCPTDPQCYSVYAAGSSGTFRAASRAPEIDPGGVGTAMTLLMGGLMVVRGRRPA